MTIKDKKSNNQKKPNWYCFTSKSNMLRQLRASDILTWFSCYDPSESSIKACELDILEFINRECRCVKKLSK